LTTTFAAGEEEWRARLSTLRQVVRQELMTRQLAAADIENAAPRC
jgi:S-adenosylmethionine-dependent methyltransferase